MDEVAYTARCGICVGAETVEFESPEDRATWMAAHTEAVEHDAWYLGEARV